jgi:nucleotide-binding universal stress UspA family protein
MSISTRTSDAESRLGRGEGLERGARADLAARVSRRAEPSTIRSVAEARDGPGPVVIATDGSESAEEAVIAGAGVARTLGTTAVLVYVRPSLGPLGDPYYQEKLSEQMAHARAALDRAHALVGEDGAEAEEEILEGTAADRIVELARARNAPLIVVGSRGLGAVAGALLGSVASAIIHRADRPVLVVPRPARR